MDHEVQPCQGDSVGNPSLWVNSQILIYTSRCLQTHLIIVNIVDLCKSELVTKFTGILAIQMYSKCVSYRWTKSSLKATNASKLGAQSPATVSLQTCFLNYHKMFGF